MHIHPFSDLIFAPRSSTPSAYVAKSLDCAMAFDKLESLQADEAWVAVKLLGMAKDEVSFACFEGLHSDHETRCTAAYSTSSNLYKQPTCGRPSIRSCRA